MSGKTKLRGSDDTFQKLKQVLTYPSLIKSINEERFPDYVKTIRKFKKDNDIKGKLRDIIPKESKSSDLKALAKKFDIFIPLSGLPFDRQAIDQALVALQSNKNRVYDKVTKGIKFPRVDDLLGPDSSVGGALEDDREMKLKPMEEEGKSYSIAKTEVRGEVVQEEGEPKLTEKEKTDIAKSIVDDVISESVDKADEKVIQDITKEVIDDVVDKEVDKQVIDERNQKIIRDMVDAGIENAVETLKQIEAEVGTQIGREMMMGQLDPQATAEEEMKEGQEAVKQAKEQRPETVMSAEEEADLVGVDNPNLADVPSASTSVEDMTPSKGMELKVSKRRKTGVDIPALPTKAELIPKERLSTRGKDIKELLNDINYFLSNFKSQLKKEKDFYNKVDKKNINQLRELHGRIVGKLQPNLPARETDKKVGVVINADEYIREQMKKILNESTFSNLRPSDVVIDVGNRKAEGRNTSDYGDFEVKKTLDGGLAVQREAVYRYMPSENDDMVNEEDQTQRQRKKPNRLALPKSRLNNERTNAIRQTVNNPFRRPQKTVKLKYLY